nr:MAG TPA: hypothetical protein [Caudoviricetes sp.]
MKYDSKKCNNLNFKLASGLSGFIKSAPNGDVYLYQNYCNWDPSTMTMMPVFWKMVRAEAFDAFVEDSGLSIVPRDPQTYTDWKVGDKVIRNTGNKINTINAMLGKAIVLVLDLDGEASITLITTDDDLTKYNKLLLTDYEKELIHAQELEEKKKKCPFKEGDKVLVRDLDTFWRFDVFVNYEEYASYPYECNSNEYELCIPLNEHTWKLLGTMDEYKEEE